MYFNIISFRFQAWRKFPKILQTLTLFFDNIFHRDKCRDARFFFFSTFLRSNIRNYVEQDFSSSERNISNVTVESSFLRWMSYANDTIYIYISSYNVCMDTHTHTYHLMNDSYGRDRCLLFDVQCFPNNLAANL